MKRRILFVPWKSGGAGTLVQDAKTFQTEMTKAGKDKSWEVVYLGDGAPFKGLGADSQIYVLGHGNRGLELIATERSGGMTATYDVVCARLVSMGLPKDYLGKIKFYNCFGAMQKEGGPGEESFAGKAALYLRNEGYTSCSIFGYWAEVLAPVYDKSSAAKSYRLDTVAQFSAKGARVQFDKSGKLVMVAPASATPGLDQNGETFDPW